MTGPFEVLTMGRIGVDIYPLQVGVRLEDVTSFGRSRDPKAYHVEYGYSCMGYEIAGGIGAKMAAPDRDIYVMVGDGSYLMMSQELVTAVQENINITVVLVQNHGFASIGALSETVGVPRFGTWYRYRNPATGRLDGDVLPVDLAANARSLGVRVHEPGGIAGLRDALARARQEDGPSLIQILTDPLIPAPSSDAWWDVPVAEVSELPATLGARKSYEAAKTRQRPFITPAERPGDERPDAAPERLYVALGECLDIIDTGTS